MPFVPVPNTAKVAVLWKQFGQKLVSTLWFEKASAWSSTDLVDLATAVNSWVVAEVLPHLSDTLNCEGTEARDMSALGAAGVLVPITPAASGAAGGGGMPTNVTAAIKFLTGLTGRSHRGRNFIPGIAPASISADAITSGSQAVFVAMYNALADYLVDLAATHVVASLYSGIGVDGKPTPRPEGVTTPVITYAMDTALDSMRRRLIGRGD